MLVSGRALRVTGGDGVSRAATVERADRADDLALLRAPGVGGPANRGRTPSGAPAGAGMRLLMRRDGRATALRVVLRRRIEATVGQAGAPPSGPRPALELAATVAPGDSGAPVLDGDGTVIGVVFARSSTRAGIAYAVDVAALGPRRR